MKTMDCENLFCIYWEEGHCLLRNISLNMQGICQSYLCVDVQDEILQHARKAMLKKYENEHKE